MVERKTFMSAVVLGVGAALTLYASTIKDTKTTNISENKKVDITKEDKIIDVIAKPVKEVASSTRDLLDEAVKFPEKILKEFSSPKSRVKGSNEAKAYMKAMRSKSVGRMSKKEHDELMKNGGEFEL